MNRIIQASLSTLLLLACLLPASPVARAEEYVCTGALGAVTVDNLRVPSQVSCLLNGTTLQGTLKVERDAHLNAQAVTVVGNVQAEGAANVTVAAGSTVGGSIQIKQGGAAKIDKVRVTGDIQFFQNRGSIKITNNTVNGNLQCKENNPAPTGGNNQVQGNKEDQCARL